MHEMSIAQSILDIILQESGNHKVTRVLSVALKVGELSAVETESLRFCVQVTCRCQDCGSNFTVQELVFNCPSCQGVRVEMLSGRELSVESFEAE
jgi:hydrogenase nickel incorporation protein HypA/HybF